MTLASLGILLSLPSLLLVSAWTFNTPIAPSRTWSLPWTAWSISRRAGMGISGIGFQRHRLERHESVNTGSDPPTVNTSDEKILLVSAIDETLLDVDDLWNATIDTGYFSSSAHTEMKIGDSDYRSRLLATTDQWNTFWESLHQRTSAAEAEISSLSSQSTIRSSSFRHLQQQIDPFWEQIKLEAEMALRVEPQAGPQLYQTILSQPTLLSAICTVVSHEIETELIPATTLKNLFMELLLHPGDRISSNTVESNINSNSSSSSNSTMASSKQSTQSPARYIPSYEEYCIRQDLQAVASREPSVRHAMDAVLFHNGFHALVCYRVGHCLWQANRTALAYYMQSAVSRIYSADIHPACTLGSGLYLSVGSGVVIGETAVVENDVTILEGVTLGGTGKEGGDRHPKVGSAVIIQNGAAVLGNIRVGDGAIITAKSIVTKPVPPLAIVSGVPAKVVSSRNMLHTESEWDDLDRSLIPKYLAQWRMLSELHSTMKQS